MGTSVSVEPYNATTANGLQSQALHNHGSRPDEVLEPSPASRRDSYLPKGSEIIGTLFFEGPVVIDGAVQGDITGADKIAVDENGVVTADEISARSVVIGGALKANTVRGHLVEILVTGRVVGECDVVADLFSIHEGAQFEGNVLAGECREVCNRNSRE